MLLFAVKDMKAQLFAQPFAQRTKAEAMRAWDAVANGANSQISDYPNDFRLYCLASFNVETGVLDVYPRPEDMGSAADVKKAPA